MGEGRAEALENTGDFIQLKQCYNYVSEKVEKVLSWQAYFQKVSCIDNEEEEKVF